MAGQPPAHRSIGPYQLDELLGRGGMAEVYRARRTGPGGFEKVLALKRILPSYARDPRLVGRFLDEARLCARLDHSNLVHVVDFGAADGEYYLVMEWVDGSNLFALLRAVAERGQVLPAEVTAYVIAEAAAGLEEAHGLRDEAGRPLGLVHRDVSPQNILLSRKGDVKVSDFGIAKALGSSVKTATGVQIGKLCYMSPEQARQEPLDARADVYALGVVLWECLAGRPLFPRGFDAESLKAVLEPKVAPPSRFSAAVPPALDALTLRALSPTREARTASAGTVGRELRVWLHGVAPGFGQSELAAFLSDRLPAPRGADAPPVQGALSTVTFEPPAPPPEPPEVMRPAPVSPLPATRPGTARPPRPRRSWAGCLLALVALAVIAAAGVGLCAWKVGLLTVPAIDAQGGTAAEVPELTVQTAPAGALVITLAGIAGTTPLQMPAPRELALMLRGYVPVLVRDPEARLRSGPLQLVPTAAEHAVLRVDCWASGDVAVGGQVVAEQPALVVIEVAKGAPVASLTLVSNGKPPAALRPGPLPPWEVTVVEDGSGCPTGP